MTTPSSSATRGCNSRAIGPAIAAGGLHARARFLGHDLAAAPVIDGRAVGAGDFASRLGGPEQGTPGRCQPLLRTVRSSRFWLVPKIPRIAFLVNVTMRDK